MTATINASTSSGVVITPDNSGAIALQNAGTTGLNITASGQVTTPLQPGFAYINAAITLVGSTYLNFNNGTVNYDVGGMLSLTGGPSGSTRVTIPVNGYYFISFSVLSNTDNSRVEITIMKNGGSFLATNATAANYTNADITQIVYLAAGDYLDINKNAGTIYTGASNHGIHYGVRLIG